MASRWAKAPVAGLPVKMGSSSYRDGHRGRGLGPDRHRLAAGDDLGGQASQPAWCPASGCYAPVTACTGHWSPLSASS